MPNVMVMTDTQVQYLEVIAVTYSIEVQAPIIPPDTREIGEPEIDEESFGSKTPCCEQNNCSVQ